MGGIPIRIRVWAGRPGELRRVRPRCQSRVAELERRWSSRRQDSELARVAAADGQLVSVAPATWQLVSLALDWARRSAGAFDPTAGPLVELWRSAAASGTWPSPQRLAEARARVGPGHVRLASDGRMALDPGSRLDLGAIAKGFMADELVRLLVDAGFLRGRVEVGGELALFDRRARPSPFRVGIRNPAGDGVLAAIEVHEGGVATSGCYERGWTVAGRRVCHIVDPRTGMPVPGGLSVTVTAPTGTEADALATALVVRGAADALAWVETLPGVEAVLVLERMEPGSPSLEPARREVRGGAAMRVIATSGLAHRMAWPRLAGVDVVETSTSSAP